MPENAEPRPLEYESPVDRRRRRPSRRKTRIILSTIAGVTLFALISLSLLGHAINGFFFYKQRVVCSSNLRLIGQACQVYSNHHQGRYPTDFATLLAEEDISAEVFLCPWRNTVVPTTYPSSWVITGSDYVYAGAGLTTTAPPQAIVAYERPNAHDGEGMNILFADGHFEFIAKKDLPATFQASFTARQKWEASQPTTSRSNP
jgi:prepilin-type processing-associated H-X9-DG protein